MKLSTKLFAGFTLISFIFMAVAFINFSLSKDVLENSNWVAQSQVMIRNSSALQRNIIDMETGLRGFLLTGQEEFLTPYVQAKDQLPALFRDTKNMLSNSPEQLRHVESIYSLQNIWEKDFAEILINEKRTAIAKHKNSLSDLNSHDLILNQKGKMIIDSTRVLFKKFNALEYQIREERRQRLDSSTAYTRKVTTALTIFTVLLGLAWAYYITRIITGRIMTMVRLADRISKGDYKTQMADTQHDELSKLSSSLNVMATTIDRNITELERKNKELDQFAYVVSHDLKAPLRGIENASRWIEEDMGKELPLNIQEYLMMMRIRVHRMENLINGILALARIGRIKLLEELVNVNSLIHEVLEMLDIPAHFKIEMPSDFPTVYTVRIHLQQVLSNLISNAIKYNDKPAGLIKLAWQDLGSSYEFRITDNGPGIDPEYHDRIFVIFQTLNERDAVESTGVGLAIVKKIIERQGGSIRVESVVGEGTTFIFTWAKIPPHTTNSL